MIRQAALLDPDSEALWDRIQSDFYENQRAIVQARWTPGGARARPRRRRRRADILWTLNHPDVWQLLVARRGWTPEQWSSGSPTPRAVSSWIRQAVPEVACIESVSAYCKRLPMEPGARKPGSSALRIGVIGAGRIGSFHVRTLASLPGIASVTVCDADAARARRLAAELGVALAATPDGSGRRGVDALVIATPTPAHAPMLRAGGRAPGCPAFCEKPVALDARDARRA